MKRTAATPRPTYTPVPVDLVMLDYAKDRVDGTRIMSKDKQIFVSVKGLTVSIEPTDRIRDPSGKDYEIVPPVKPLDPSGSLVVFVEIQGRI